jgi:hypothetical protein
LAVPPRCRQHQPKSNPPWLRHQQEEHHSHLAPPWSSADQTQDRPRRWHSGEARPSRCSRGVEEGHDL